MTNQRMRRSSGGRQYASLRHSVERIGQKKHPFRMAAQKIRGLIAHVGDDRKSRLLDLRPYRRFEVGDGREARAVGHGIELLVAGIANGGESAFRRLALALGTARDEEDGDAQRPRLLEYLQDGNDGGVPAAMLPRGPSPTR